MYLEIDRAHRAFPRDTQGVFLDRHMGLTLTAVAVQMIYPYLLALRHML